MTKTRSSPKPATHSGEPIGHCYRALLETSSSAILLLSPESIILGWNREAETVSVWIADEALTRSYVEGGVLRIPQGTLEAPADDEHHREPVRAVRPCTDAAKRFKKTANATAKFWRLLLVAEKRFRKIDAPRLASEIHRGGVLEDGVQVTKQNQRAAA